MAFKKKPTVDVISMSTTFHLCRMVFKKKLPLAVIISMSTMLMMHVFMPINLHSSGDGADDATNQQKRAVAMHQMEACPEDG